MAATNYTPISLYYSATATNVPLAANLVAGELAINTNDGKLFYKDSSGVVQVMASKAGSVNVSSFSAGSTGFTPSTATTGAVTLAGTLATTNGGTGLTSFTSGGVVYASSSSALTTGSALTFDGANLGIGTSLPQARLSVQYADSAPTSSGTIFSGVVFQYSAGGSALNMGTSSGGYAYFNSAFANNAGVGQAYRFYQGATQAMTLDASGNLGIGTSSPGSYGKLAVFSGATANTAFLDSTAASAYSAGSNFAGSVLTLRSGANATGNATGIRFASNANGAFEGLFAYVQNASAYGDFVWQGYNGSYAERMRLDSSGNLLVNGTSSVSSASKIQVFVNGGNGATGYIGSFHSGSNLANQSAGYMIGKTDLTMFSAYDGSGNPRNNIYLTAITNGVYLAANGTSWTSLSDARKKDIIEPIFNAANKVSQLRAVIGKYKTDEDGTRRSFLIAQDVQAVFPEAVDTNDPENWGVQYSDVIPLLVAAIKEQQALIESLTTRLSALESK